MNEDLLNYVTFLLNGHEYKRSVIDSNPDSKEGLFYTQYGRTSLDAKINPLSNQLVLKKYQRNRQIRPKQAKPAHNEFLISNIKKWKKGIYEDFLLTVTSMCFIPSLLRKPSLPKILIQYGIL